VQHMLSGATCIHGFLFFRKELGTRRKCEIGENYHNEMIKDVSYEISLISILCGDVKLLTCS
jgi:hypothetical protein